MGTPGFVHLMNYYYRSQLNPQRGGLKPSRTLDSKPANSIFMLRWTRYCAYVRLGNHLRVNAERQASGGSKCVASIQANPEIQASNMSTVEPVMASLLFCSESSSENQHAHACHPPRASAIRLFPGAVSYTHLRAHETEADL
eukprot:869502-Amphidinium_carterae.1